METNSHKKETIKNLKDLIKINEENGQKINLFNKEYRLPIQEQNKSLIQPIDNNKLASERIESVEYLQNLNQFRKFVSYKYRLLN